MLWGAGLVGCAEQEQDFAGAQAPESVRAALERGVGMDVIVELAAGVSAPRLFDSASARVIRDLELPALRAFSRLPLVKTRVESVEELERLEGDGRVLAIFEDVALKRHATSAAAFINQPAAAARGYEGAGVGVAVLDTGVDWSHASFGSCTGAGSAGCRVVKALDFAPDDGSLDDDGHGTNVAGAVLAVAPGANILALDVFDGETAKSSDVLEAINWVIDNRAAHDISVINLSIGSGRFEQACQSNVFGTAIATARAAGIATVSSAGNEGFKDALAQPACVPDALSVGAVYDSDLGSRVFTTCADSSSKADQIACFSNTADFLDITAPGVSVNAGGFSMSGTSQAAPLVSGGLAVLRAAYPLETMEQVRARLIQRAPLIQEARAPRLLPRLDLSASLDPLGVACAVDVSAERVAASVQGGVYEVGVQTGPGCEWAFESRVDWLTLEVGQGSGPGVMRVSVSPNVRGKRGALLFGPDGVEVGVVQQEAALPQGELILSYGDHTTRRDVVTMKVEVTQGEPTEMCVSTGVRCEAWRPFEALSLMDISGEDGWRFVRVWLRDARRQTSRPLEASVVLDTTPPEDGAAELERQAGAVMLRWRQAHDPVSGVMFYRVVAREDTTPRHCLDDGVNQVVYQGLKRSARHERATSHMLYYRICAMDYALNLSGGVTLAGGPR